LTGYQPLLEIRRVAGQFVTASAAAIALTQNATMGMNFLANGLDLAAGDEVVSTDQEHGGGISPWRLLAKRRGIVVKELPLEPALAEGPDAIVRQFESAMTARTKVVMFSHITSGLGALAIVDGAQAVGQIQVDVRALGCDAYVGSPHKWMLAPSFPVHAMRHRQRSGRGRAAGGASFHRDSRHAADRALGREPHQAAA
jgi:selenocysteine lyase/cysteine desulfurase